jgi:GNAT superfamily N-acetyltransferase
MSTVLIDVRPARPSDANALSEVHDESWSAAYRGILPGVVLDKMLARRGPAYWQRVARRSSGGTLVLIFDGVVAGYTTLGPNRTRRLTYGGEIYEIYLRPSHQGVGLGRRLFREARRTLLRRHPVLPFFTPRLSAVAVAYPLRDRWISTRAGLFSVAPLIDTRIQLPNTVRTLSARDSSSAIFWVSPRGSQWIPSGETSVVMVSAGWEPST